ncbi:MAG: autotransporter outer membrane beta-barrel domain-containing protein [Muribaculum sp.]|nr:autotransporter outer membrane beta-barrel domain-containing protein [Muribaculum sp.]
MKIIRLLIFSAVAMSGFCPVMARPLSIVERVMVRDLPVERMRSAIYESSPAIMLMKDSLSLSVLSVGGDFKRSDEAYMMQLGTGHSLFSINADSYMRMPSNSVVWGNARFTTGANYDIRWTDCVDYLRLAPYVLGDAVGGDMSTRCYEFGGGWAKAYGRWSVGIHADYRARVDYRNRDPRVKTVVSDLNFDAGVAYRLSGRYNIGLSGGINVYNQNCDVDFYNPINDIDTYTLTGLGSYYARFMGNTNKNSGYSSFGYRAGVQFVSSDYAGWGIQAGYDAYRMDQLLRNYNNLTLGYSDVSRLSGSVSYRFTLSQSFSLMPEAKVSYIGRKGTENLFGTSTGTSYPKIGSRSLYRHEITEAGLYIPIEYVCAKSRLALALVPSVSYTRDHEWLLSPDRDVDVSHLRPGLDIAYSGMSDLWLWRIDAGACRSFSSVSASKFSDLDMSSDLGRCVMHNYEMLASTRTSAHLSAGVSRAVDGLLVGFDLKYSLTAFEHHGNCHGVAVVLSVKF